MYLIYIPVYYNVEVKRKYSITPLIRIVWDGGQSGYSENADNWFFSLKIDYIGSFQF